VGVKSDSSSCWGGRNRTPKRRQRRYYSGKQKCHTLKAQVLIDWESGQIICTAIGTGRTHDFKLLKRSRLPLTSAQLGLADRGYQGFAKQFVGACLPTKKPRKQKLSKAEKQHNRALAKLRVRVEHVIRRFKIFRIFSGRYRNRRKRFGLRLNLIAGLLNYELAHAS
jgi:DDE superfamily endonuclease